MIEPIPGLKFSTVDKHALLDLEESTNKNGWSLFASILSSTMSINCNASLDETACCNSVKATRNSV